MGFNLEMQRQRKKKELERQKQSLLTLDTEVSKSSLDELTKLELKAGVSKQQGILGVQEAGRVGTGELNQYGILQGGNIGDLAGYFAKAKEGIDPIFKARARVQSAYDTLVDQPGARQLRTSNMFSVGASRLRA